MACFALKLNTMFGNGVRVLQNSKDLLYACRLARLEREKKIPDDVDCLQETSYMRKKLYTSDTIESLLGIRKSTML